MLKPPSSSALRILRQLYLLRNLTIALIALLVVAAVFWLDIRLPVMALSIILLVMASTNGLTWWLIHSGRPVTETILFSQLLVEIFSFALILYFSGGATNPFTFFFLIPLAISATVFPDHRTWLLTALTMLLYTVLLVFYQPLGFPMSDHSGMNSSGAFSLHVLGMWFGFMVSALLLSWFVTHLSQELKRRDRAIAQARQRELRDQQMVTLGTLAAGTAHELGSPLASVAIISDDITEGFDRAQYPELFEQQALLRQQVQRCKEILSVLSSNTGESRADAGYRMAAEDFIQTIIQQWQQQRPQARFQLAPTTIPATASLLFDTTLSQALLNLLNNAADVSDDPIEISSLVEADRLMLDIRDHGQGFSDEQIALAGETVFSSKPDGMGIGLFLAITTIRRCGGEVRFERCQPNGTRSRIQLPLFPQDETVKTETRSLDHDD